MEGKAANSEYQQQVEPQTGDDIAMNIEHNVDLLSSFWEPNELLGPFPPSQGSLGQPLSQCSQRSESWNIDNPLLAAACEKDDFDWKFAETGSVMSPPEPIDGVKGRSVFTDDPRQGVTVIEGTSISYTVSQDIAAYMAFDSTVALSPVSNPPNSPRTRSSSFIVPDTVGLLSPATEEEMPDDNLEIDALLNQLFNEKESIKTYFNPEQSQDSDSELIPDIDQLMAIAASQQSFSDEAILRAVEQQPQQVITTSFEPQQFSQRSETDYDSDNQLFVGKEIASPLDVISTDQVYSCLEAIISREINLPEPSPSTSTSISITAPVTTQVTAEDKPFVCLKPVEQAPVPVRRSSRKPSKKRKVEEVEEEENEEAAAPEEQVLAKVAKKVSPKKVIKQVQNKLAAKRYRQKKKMEAGTAETEREIEEKEFERNQKKLKGKLQERDLMLNLLHQLYPDKTNPNYTILFPEWFEPGDP